MPAATGGHRPSQLPSDHCRRKPLSALSRMLTGSKKNPNEQAFVFGGWRPDVSAGLQVVITAVPQLADWFALLVEASATLEMQRKPSDDMAG